MNRAMALIAVISMAALGLGGCRSAGGESTAFTVSAGSYEATFDAAKEAVRRLGFGFERIDARGGIIRTDAVSTGGLATPWTKTEASFSQEVDSFLHRDERRVDISFETTVSGDEKDPNGVDYRSAQGDLVCRVRAIKTRLFRPGLRLSPTAVRLSSVERDLSISQGELPKAIKRTAGDDDALAGRVVRRILKEMKKSQIAATRGQAANVDAHAEESLE